MINENLTKIRTLMKEHNIDIYIIPSSDFHESEYSGAHFKTREFMSGFTGSAGTLIISIDEARLWTDGRYFLQAANQLKGSEIILMKSGLKETKTINEYLLEHSDKTIGFDGKVLNTNTVLSFNNNNLVYNLDLVNQIWINRPTLSKSKAFLYDTCYCGEARASKFKRLRTIIKDYDHHVISTLDDIAWLFNIRGKDIDCNPTILAYAIINKDDSYLYVQDEVINNEIKTILNNDNIIVKSYNDIYQDVAKLSGKILLDTNSVNYAIYKNINPKCSITDKPNPTQFLKSIKNEVEIKNIINAHIKDGVAMTKFMYWLKTNVGKIDMDELSVGEKINDFRKQQDLFYDFSFDTICGYKENGAIIHYKATKESYLKINDNGLLLTDSGGQYLDGTTDISRTFALGNISKTEKQDFTIALKALLHLQRAKFLYGTTGVNLDLLARSEVNAFDIDYQHGTGHGVGHFLGVHEGPNGFRQRDMPGRPPLGIIEPGMITTNEPGIYRNGKYGIRHENELLCVEDNENEYGLFLRFEPITYCPFDVNAIDYDLLTANEVIQLQEYHELVFKKVSPHLNDTEVNWLKDYLKL